jgi:protein TonB
MVESRSAFTSLAIHGLALLILFGLVTHPLIPLANPTVATIHVPLLTPYLSAPGAGGQRAATPVSVGRLPKIAPRQFVPPMAVINLQPKLAMVPTIEGPPDLPDLKLPNIGDPTGLSAIASAGRGGPAGYGDGPGTGVGSSTPGAGAGPAGSIIHSPGGGVTMPVPIHKVEPEYSEEARKARANGVVVVYVEIGPDGKPYNLRVARGFGFGLDEKAMEAVSKWLFKPGTKNGKPVAVAASIEVSFHLL